MVKRALIYGGGGDLASKFALQLISSGVEVDIVIRIKIEGDGLARKFKNIYLTEYGYQDFEPTYVYDIIFFPQAIFDPMPFNTTDSAMIAREFQVGLLDLINLTRKHLLFNEKNAEADRRIDFAYIGSTSAYAGFKNTAIYCAVKHGLLGFIRAMNDEYAHTNIRFWLFSMGSMKTKMGLKVQDQDYNTFLDAGDVAKRISESLMTEGNLFEPEKIIRRRVVR